MLRRRNIVIFMLVFVMLFSSVTVMANDEPVTMKISRISGSDRYETAVKISEATFESAEYVVIASGEDFPDALAGGPLAVQISAPILTVRKNSISESVIKEIERLKAKTVLVLGGVNSISAEVENTLKEKFENVERIADIDRYETAEKIMQARIRLAYPKGEEGPTSGDDLAYVSGTSYADALVAAPFVGQKYVLKPGVFITENLALAKPGENIDTHRVFGGESSVPGMTQKRVAGINRYSTAVEIANLYKTELEKEIDTVVIASGSNYPDALASAPYVASKNAVLLLTPAGSLDSNTAKYIKDNKIKNIVLIGGENSLNEKIKEDINNIDKSEPGTPDIIRIVKNDVKVISVPDPYTIVADVDGREEIIKMIGVYRHGFSIQENSENETKDIDAYNFTLERLLGKTVKLTFNGMEVDEYNRSLGYIWLDNELFNETMIREGHALAKEHPNRLMHEYRLLEAMTAAKEDKLGIWSDEFEGRPTIIDEPAPNPELKAHLFNRPLVLGDKTTKKYYTFGQPKFNDIEFGNAVFFKTMEDAIKDGYIPGEV